MAHEVEMSMSDFIAIENAKKQKHPKRVPSDWFQVREVHVGKDVRGGHVRLSSANTTLQLCCQRFCTPG